MTCVSGVIGTFSDTGPVVLDACDKGRGRVERFHKIRP